MKKTVMLITGIVLIAVYGRSILAKQVWPTYSTYLGGTGQDFGRAIDVDSSGSAYVVGATHSSNFPCENAYQTTLAGGRNVFITKFDPSGSSLAYSTYLGGTGWDAGYGISVVDGEAYVTGSTGSEDFPTENPYQPGNLGYDIFILKLNSTGSSLLYSTYLGGEGSDIAYGISVSDGEAHVTGKSTSDNFPVKNAYQTSRAHAQYYDAVITKLGSGGSSLIYSTYWGGTRMDIGNGISVRDGAAYITGQTYSSNFPTVNAYQPTLAGGGTFPDEYYDAFVSKLAWNEVSEILTVEYSTYLGGIDDDQCLGISVDSAGAAYVTGRTDSDNFPVENPYQSTLAGYGGGPEDSFITKLGPTGSSLSYSTYLGGSSQADLGYGISVEDGAAYVIGSTASDDFPTVNPYQAALNSGGSDIFVCRLNSGGSSLFYSTYFGGSDADQGLGIRVYNEVAYITGYTESNDFPVENPYQSTFSGAPMDYDAFISKLSFIATPPPTPSSTPTPPPTPSLPPTPPPTPSSNPTLVPTATPAATAIHTPIPTPTCGPAVPVERNVVVSGDYDGDGISDIAIFRESSGLWAIRGITRAYFGSSGDQPASGDYDGDGAADLAVFRDATGLWAIRGVSRIYYGTSGDLPSPRDYNGDGICDTTIFRATTGLWAARGVTRTYFGTTGDLPVPGDYNGNGMNGIALFRPATGLWAIKDVSRIYFGGIQDWPLPGDYDGDGTWNVGIFRGAAGLWALRGVTRSYYGCCLDWPVPADYDGSGNDDIGIFRGAFSLWAVRGVTRAYYGTSGDIPVTR